jgi:ABC-type bacteriocin/lantibiotic exporter with double-glycine peptidase domain
MLEICALTKRFGGTPVVQDVSFTLKPGEILGYVGPNGAGKSTTVKMIIGLLEPSEGQVRFQGRSVIEDLPGFQARIGYIAVLSAVVPVLSVMIAAAGEFWFLFPFYLLNFGGIWIWLRRLRREGWGEAKLIYEDLPAVVTDLGIKDLTYAGSTRTPLYPGM